MEERLRSRTVFRGRLFKVSLDQVELSNGITVEREVVHHRGSVGVVPLTDDGKIVMVRQFRYPAGKELLEIPAGTLEPGEDPVHCAVRELTEETGYIAEQLEPLGQVFLCPGYCTERIHLFLARGLRKGRQLTDIDEKITVELIDLGDVADKIRGGEIADAKSICGIYLMEPLKRIT
ncbi:MAG: NUDIX hydrolase [Candidatus Bathyarchaeia archaeon]